MAGGQLNLEELYKKADEVSLEKMRENRKAREAREAGETEPEVRQAISPSKVEDPFRFCTPAQLRGEPEEVTEILEEVFVDYSTENEDVFEPVDPSKFGIRQDECRNRETSSLVTRSGSVTLVPGKDYKTVSKERPISSTERMLRRLNYSGIKHKWQFLEQLNRHIPINDFSLPVFIYRPDLLDHELFVEVFAQNSAENAENGQLLLGFELKSSQNGQNGQNNQESTSFGSLERIAEAESMIEASIIPLSYDNGYPCLPNGDPLWTRLEFEPVIAFQGFMQFLELTGARRIDELITVQPDDKREWSTLYLWRERAKAFDLYKLANHQKVKLQRMLQVEDSHYNKAEKLLNKLDAAFQDDEKFAHLDIDKAVGVLEKLIKIQRISVGLGINGSENETPKMPSMEMIVKQAAVKQVEKADESVNHEEFVKLLENPEGLAQAQELIIKINSGA